MLAVFRACTPTHDPPADFAGSGDGAGLLSLLELTSHQAAMPTRNAAPKPVLAYGWRAYACMFTDTVVSAQPAYGMGW